jgi:hypothetical protein
MVDFKASRMDINYLELHWMLIFPSILIRLLHSIRGIVPIPLMLKMDFNLLMI